MVKEGISYPATGVRACIVVHPAANIFREVHTQSSRIELPSSEGTHFIRIGDILYCEAESNYCRLFFTSGEQFLVSQTLKHISALLPSGSFLRVHAKYLVAADEVKFLGTDHLILSGKQHIPVARSRRKEVAEELLLDSF